MLEYIEDSGDGVIAFYKHEKSLQNLKIRQNLFENGGKLKNLTFTSLFLNNFNFFETKFPLYMKKTLLPAGRYDNFFFFLQRLYKSPDLTYLYPARDSRNKIHLAAASARVLKQMRYACVSPCVCVCVWECGLSHITDPQKKPGVY